MSLTTHSMIYDSSDIQALAAFLDVVLDVQIKYCNSVFHNSSSLYIVSIRKLQDLTLDLVRLKCDLSLGKQVLNTASEVPFKADHIV